VLPSEWALEELERRITGKGIEYRRGGEPGYEDVLFLTDPAGNGVALAADY
jgi:catechol-2,3-dioxygenase